MSFLFDHFKNSQTQILLAAVYCSTVLLIPTATGIGLILSTHIMALSALLYTASLLAKTWDTPFEPEDTGNNFNRIKCIMMGALALIPVIGLTQAAITAYTTTTLLALMQSSHALANPATFIVLMVLLPGLMRFAGPKKPIRSFVWLAASLLIASVGFTLCQNLLTAQQMLALLPNLPIFTFNLAGICMLGYLGYKMWSSLSLKPFASIHNKSAALTQYYMKPMTPAARTALYKKIQGFFETPPSLETIFNLDNKPLLRNIIKHLWLQDNSYTILKRLLLTIDVSDDTNQQEALWQNIITVLKHACIAQQTGGSGPFPGSGNKLGNASTSATSRVKKGPGKSLLLPGMLHVIGIITTLCFPVTHYATLSLLGALTLYGASAWTMDVLFSHSSSNLSKGLYLLLSVGAVAGILTIAISKIMGTSAIVLPTLVACYVITMSTLLAGHLTCFLTEKALACGCLPKAIGTCLPCFAPTTVSPQTRPEIGGTTQQTASTEQLTKGAIKQQ